MSYRKEHKQKNKPTIQDYIDDYMAAIAKGDNVGEFLKALSYAYHCIAEDKNENT